MFRLKSPPILELLTWVVAKKVLRRRLVYHCDDALHVVARPRWLRIRFRLADCVLTGNAAIAEFAGSVTPHVLRYDGAVDVARYSVKTHSEHSPVVIGWIGHGARDVLRSFLPAIRQVCKAEGARLKVVSDAPIDGEDGRIVEFESWVLQREFQAFEDFDIGIMPLDDTSYNRGKEAYKIKEYMAAGLPVVCSPVGHNIRVLQEGVTGFFARTHEEWVLHLTTLIRDVNLRTSMGSAGRNVVERHYDVAAQAERLGRLLRALAQAPSASAAFDLPTDGSQEADALPSWRTETEDQSPSMFEVTRGHTGRRESLDPRVVEFEVRRG